MPCSVKASSRSIHLSRHLLIGWPTKCALTFCIPFKSITQSEMSQKETAVYALQPKSNLWMWAWFGRSATITIYHFIRIIFECRPRTGNGTPNKPIFFLEENACNVLIYLQLSNGTDLSIVQHLGKRKAGMFDGLSHGCHLSCNIITVEIVLLYFFFLVSDCRFSSN